MKSCGCCLIVLLATFLSEQPAPAQTVGAVVNGASFLPAVSPGALISIFGTGLSRSQVNATAVPLPRKLENTTVTIGGIDAPLYFVSPGQINAQAPFELTAKTASLVVTTADGQSAPYTLSLTPTSPGLFTAASNGKGRALYFDPSFKQLDIPAPGSTIILYATGLGVTNPPAATGAGGAAAEPLNRAAKAPDVYIGETKAQVAYAGLAPGFVGVYQLNVVVPSSALATNRLFIRTTDMASNVTEVGVPQNVANVTGSIQFVYPTAATKATFSPVPVIASFSTRFDLMASAGPFKVAALSEGGSSVIDFDPAAGRFSASATVPTTAARMGDFSNAGIRVIDFAARGLPMPGNIVPASRLDPAAISAFQMLPMPNQPSTGGATALFQTAGSASRGSTFVVDVNNNYGISWFAGFLQIPYVAANKSCTTTVELWVDGRLVSSGNVTFALP